MLVFSLGWWCTRIPTGRLRPRGTWDTTSYCADFTYRAFTFYGLASQLILLSCSSHVEVPQPLLNCFNRFRLYPVRSPLLGVSRTWFIFLRVLRCFSSPRSLQMTTLLVIRSWASLLMGLPHSDTCGSKLVRQLSALFRGLLRPSSPICP